GGEGDFALLTIDVSGPTGAARPPSGRFPSRTGGDLDVWEIPDGTFAAACAQRRSVLRPRLQPQLVLHRRAAHGVVLEVELAHHGRRRRFAAAKHAAPRSTKPSPAGSG